MVEIVIFAKTYETSMSIFNTQGHENIEVLLLNIACISIVLLSPLSWALTKLKIQALWKQYHLNK